MLTRRPITDADLPFLAEVYASTRAEEMANSGWTPEAILAFLMEQFHLQHHHYQTHYRGTAFELLLVDGVPAGRLYVARWSQELRIVDIALLPIHQGRGYGRQLMMELLDEADRTGKCLSLHVEQNNRVLAWYRRLGFREVDTHGVYYRMERQPRVAEGVP